MAERSSRIGGPQVLTRVSYALIADFLDAQRGELVRSVSVGWARQLVLVSVSQGSGIAGYYPFVTILVALDRPWNSVEASQPFL